MESGVTSINLGNTLGGTVVIHLDGIWPWPTPAAIPIAESALEDGLLRITAEPTGRLRLAVFRHDSSGEQLVVEQATCPIISDGPFELKIAATWLPEGITIAANGSYIGAPDNPDWNPPSFRISRAVQKPLYDFGKDNALAMAARRDRFMGWQAPGKRVRGDRSYTLTSLKSETLQLRDLLR